LKGRQKGRTKEKKRKPRRDQGKKKERGRERKEVKGEINMAVKPPSLLHLVRLVGWAHALDNGFSFSRFPLCSHPPPQKDARKDK
jgi:hypothetical protein